MKIYKGTEIMNVIDIMDEIIYKSSLSTVFDNEPHHYKELVDGFPELLDDMICYFSDDMKSYMFISTDYNDYSIDVAMWASMDNTVGFKQTLQYFNALKDLYKKIKILLDYSITQNIISVDGILNANFTLKGEKVKV